MMINDIQKLDTGLLSQKSLNELQELIPSIRHDWDVKPIFRTETEARLCVLNDIHHPTPHAKYWQSVREQQVHFNELVMLVFDYKRKGVEIRKLERKMEEELDDLELELLSIDLDQKRYEIELCDKVARERMRELHQWDKIKKELLASSSDIDVDDCEGREHLKSHTKRFITEWMNSGNITDPGSAQNIIGKAQTGIKRCKEVGLWDEVIAELNLDPASVTKLIGA